MGFAPLNSDAEDGSGLTQNQVGRRPDGKVQFEGKCSPPVAVAAVASVVAILALILACAALSKASESPRTTTTLMTAPTSRRTVSMRERSFTGCHWSRARTATITRSSAGPMWRRRGMTCVGGVGALRARARARTREPTLRSTRPSPQALWDSQWRCYEGKSGHLAYINSQEENDFLENLVKSKTTSSTQVWIGGSDAHTEGASSRCSRACTRAARARRERSSRRRRRVMLRLWRRRVHTLARRHIRVVRRMGLDGHGLLRGQCCCRRDV